MRISDWSADVCSSALVTNGPPRVIDQIIAQLERLVPVHRVTDLTENGPYVERELALVKVAGHGDQRIEALRLADVYRARVVDATIDSFIFEITGGSEKGDTFINLMRHVGLVEVARNGIVGITRGKEEAGVIALALLWWRGMRGYRKSIRRNSRR